MRRILLLLSFLLPLIAWSQTYWGKLQGGPNVDETTSVYVDNNDNTYTTGYFSTSAGINGSTQSVVGLTDVFLTKIAPNGDSDWTISFGSPSSDRGLDVGVDGSGNVFVSGFFNNSINFGSGVVITANGNSTDAFIAKFSPSGTIIWAQSAGGSGNNDRANALSVHTDGSVVITGQYSGTADFSGQSITSLNNSIDAFIAKYNSNGDIEWVRSGSGDATDIGYGIVTDNAGSVYACGQFSGDITWDNTYPNTIINACFIVKYSSSGEEQWFRWGGGSSQSTAYDITTNGTNVYAVGDFGETITFFGGSSNQVISSSDESAVFIVAYGSSGNYLWGSEEHSSSPVSGRGIDHRNGELAITGWYECTFTSISENYGESAFNSIGFRDVYVMRYNTSGSFIWGRNFGSQGNEEGSDVGITSNNQEVIVGVFSEELFIPLSLGIDSEGLFNWSGSPNPNLTYCSDPNYGDFKWLDGAGSLDGFTLRVIDLSRAPYDYYNRLGSGCDLGIPEPCIVRQDLVNTQVCPDTLIDCATYSVFGENFVSNSTQLGYSPTYSWSLGGSSSGFSVSNPGNLSVTISSADGCYSQSASVYVDVFPPAAAPLISDNLGVNNATSNPAPLEVCPDEVVLLTVGVQDGETFEWSGSGISDDEQNSVTVTADESGVYSVSATNEFGCTRTTFIVVNIIEDAPPIEPFLIFPDAVNDTIYTCGNGGSAMLMDGITDELVISSEFDFDWTLSPSGTVNGLTNLFLGVTTSGWYTVSGTIVTEPNECFDQLEYTVEDSIYIELLPNPEVSITVTGPSVICAGDTIALFMDYTGTISYSFEPIEEYEDSVLVSGTGTYGFSVTETNEFGCTSSASTNLNIGSVQSPEIGSNPFPAVICPGDSVQLLISTPGTVLWQGPGVGDDDIGSSLFVNTPGNYFAEVTFYEGCALVSNTLEVVEYATPFLSGSNEFICQGDSVVISVVTNAEGTIEWQAPFSGSDSSQVIFDPGIYTVVVTGCGVSTEVSIEVEVNETEVFIEGAFFDPLCEGDSVLFTATPGFPEYTWTSGGVQDSTYVFESGAIQVSALDTNNCIIQSNILEVAFTDLPISPQFVFDPVCEGEAQEILINSSAEIYYVDENGNVLQTDPLVLIDPFVQDTTLYAYLIQDFCQGPTNQLNIGPKPFPDPPIIGSDAPVCTGTILGLDVLNDDGQSVYVWQVPTGISVQGASVNLPVPNLAYEGIYFCHANLNDCRSDTLSLEVSLFETVQAVLPEDAARCLSEDFRIEPDTVFASYSWQDGSELSFFIPSESGTIVLQTLDFNGCPSSDAMEVLVEDCNVDIMNVFTPNGDGINDIWFVNANNPRRYILRVYNRWGTQVYSSENGPIGWDGINQNTGRDCTEGSYPFILEMINFEGGFQNYSGMINLIRD